MYVADGKNHRIQVFTDEGVYLKQFGKEGRGEGELNQPGIIAIDSSNAMLYVGERGNDRVSIFSTDGEFIKSFGRRGECHAEFNQIRGLAVDGRGALYVSDRENKRIQIFY